MEEVTVDSIELGKIVFGNIHDIELMDSQLSVEDRMRILHREIYVESDGSTMQITPIGSNIVVLLHLSPAPLQNDVCMPIVGAVFDSDFNFKQDLRTAFCYFRSHVDLHNSIIDGMAMIGCYFESPIHLDSSIMTGNVVFDGSTFFNDAVFTGAVFKEKASFSHCTFLHRCDFNSTEFRGKASFRSSHFYDNTDFEDAYFRNKALFDTMTFKYENSPNGPSHFYKAVSFKNAKFDHFAIFNGTRFLGIANFNSAMFNSKTYFEGKSDDASRYAKMNFYRTRFGTYTCFGDIIVGSIVFKFVTCQGELIFDKVTFDNPMKIDNFISSGYVTFRNLTFTSKTKSLSLQNSIFNGDLDIQTMTVDADEQPIERIILRSCWIAGHFHFTGNISGIDVSGTTFNGPLAMDIQKRMSVFSMAILNTSINSSAEFRWISVREVEKLLIGDVVSPISCHELFVSIRGLKNKPSEFTYEEVASQMLTLRSVMVRMGKFDDSDFFLRKYNDLHRKPSGNRPIDRFATLASRASSFGARIIGSYGTRPIQILLWMAVIPMIIGGCIAMLRGDILGGFLDGFVAFITMSLGVDTSELSDLEKTLLVADGFLGVFLMSFFVTSLARKLFS